MTASKSPRNKALSALKALNRDKATVTSAIPELFPYGVVATKPRDPKNDRSLALITGTVVEQGLEHALLAFFSPGTGDAEINARDVLFDGEAPVLGDFSAKVKVAKVAGIIGPRASGDLQLIRAIRNAFAHNRKMLSFDTPEIVGVCEELVCPIYWNAIMEGQIAQDAREKFIQTCFQLSLYLYTYPSDRDDPEHDGYNSEFSQRRRAYLTGRP
jgi:DNA-binding MltR family transcriptional regulator